MQIGQRWRYLRVTERIARDACSSVSLVERIIEDRALELVEAPVRVGKHDAQQAKQGRYLLSQCVGAILSFAWRQVERVQSVVRRAGQADVLPASGLAHRSVLVLGIDDQKVDP